MPGTDGGPGARRPFSPASTSPMTETPQELAARLNLETGRVRWPELQRHFARGSVLLASRDIDLIEAGSALIRDDTAAVAAWKKRGQLRLAEDGDARRWQSGDRELWALVVAPWVLVQEAKDPG